MTLPLRFPKEMDRLIDQEQKLSVFCGRSLHQNDLARQKEKTLGAILTPEDIAALCQIETCTIANAIEAFKIRLRNEGFMNSSISSLFSHLPPMVGYAVTARIRCSNPPAEGHIYFDRTDWWDHVLKTPEPRVVVLEDVDESPGFGSLLGEVHASILKALGCVGAITNGSVRDLPAVGHMQFPFFAGSVAVSHAYAHFVDFGGEVEVGGLKVKTGDLLHGDRHGVISIPPQIAAGVPAQARLLRESEQKVIAVCRSTGFSVEKLREAIEAIKENRSASQITEAGGIVED